MSDLICNILLLYSLVVLARIILSFFQVPYDHPVGRVTELLSILVDPVLEPIRRFIPPVRTGAVALDLSPLILLVVLGILRGQIC